MKQIESRWRNSQLSCRPGRSGNPASALGQRRLDDLPLAARLNLTLESCRRFNQRCRPRGKIESQARASRYPLVLAAEALLDEGSLADREAALSKFQEVTRIVAKSCLSEATPNPERIDCPTDSELTRLAEHPRGANSSITSTLPAVHPAPTATWKFWPNRNAEQPDHYSSAPQFLAPELRDYRNHE
jgi:hypothetical protein